MLTAECRKRRGRGGPGRRSRARRRRRRRTRPWRGPPTPQGTCRCWRTDTSGSWELRQSEIKYKIINKPVLHFIHDIYKSIFQNIILI